MCKPGLSPVKASFEHVNFNQFACFIWGHMGLNPSPLTELCTCAHCPILFYLILIIQFKGVCCLLLFFLFFFFFVYTQAASTMNLTSGAYTTLTYCRFCDHILNTSCDRLKIQLSSQRPLHPILK